MNIRPLPILCSLFVASAAFAQLARTDRVPMPTGIASIADINGDGLDDVVDGDGAVLFNLGGGKFSSRVAVVPAGERIVDTLDYNGDGIRDVITVAQPPFNPWAPPVSSPYTYRLYRGTGNGSFVAVDGPLPARANPTVLDFDGDGRDDLLLTSGIRQGSDYTAHLEFYRSNENATFTLTDSIDFPGGGGPTAAGSGIGAHISVGDLNGDGHGDVILRSEEEMHFLFGEGNGKFDVVTRYLPRGAGGDSLDIVDLDGDGNNDVVFNSAAINIGVMFGDGHGHFPRAATWFIPEADRPLGGGNFAVGKFGSAKLQLAVGTQRGSVVLVNVENGALKETARFSTGLDRVQVYGGAFERSGKRDLLAVGFTLPDLQGDYEGTIFLSPASAGAALDPVKVPVRPRAVRPARALLHLHVSISNDCTAYVDQWDLAPEGFFVNDANPVTGRFIEAAFVDDAYHFRITPDGTRPGVPHVRHGLFVSSGAGVFTGAANGIDACGKETVYRVEITE